MTRRGFLRFLLAAPIVGPAVVKALAAGPAPLVNPIFSGELGVWQVSQVAREELKRWLAEEIDGAVVEAFDA